MNLGRETEQIEFKKSIGELNEGIASIAAILNKHQAGELYFGVKNDGTVIGQEIGDATLRTVSQAIRSHIKPMIYPEIKTLEFDGKEVVYVKFSGTRCPYTAFNIARIRVSDEDVVMDQDTYEDMLRKRDNISGYSWETQVSKYRVEDVNEEALRAYLNRAHEANRITFEHTDTRSVLETLGLMDGDYLLNAGAALFCECNINELQMAKFATNERLTFTDIRRFTGSIMTLKEKAEQYVIDAMNWRAEFVGFSRKEIPEIPVLAVREAIVNSFGHKLFESGQANEIAVYRDRIEIYSPGDFPKNYSPEAFVTQNLPAIRRNPLITRILYYSQDMETFATGLKRIQKLCNDARCKVEFRTIAGGFIVCFYRNTEFAAENTQQSNRQNDTKELSNATDVAKGVAKDVAKDDTLESKILALIQENASMTASEMSGRLSVTQRTIQRGIEKLKNQGIVERKGGKRFGYWEIKTNKPD